MDLGFIGLGRMGSNMVRRLARAGHRVTAFDTRPEAVREIARHGATGAASLEDLTGRLKPPRNLWLMVPAGPATDEALAALVPALAPGDTLIDGGNSYYRDTVRRAETLRGKGIHFIDVGTSGGIRGLENGYSLMIGGGGPQVLRLRPIFEALAPAPDKGWGHVGPSGAGHFVKMVHNGIEYGMMQAYAEGFALMHAKGEFDLDLAGIAQIWRNGSVVRSWLLDLTAEALGRNGDLADVSPYVEDSGEGRWTVQEAIDLNVSAPVITESLLRRLRSRETAPFSDKLLAALRRSFGGHAVKKTE